MPKFNNTRETTTDDCDDDNGAELVRRHRGLGSEQNKNRQKPRGVGGYTSVYVAPTLTEQKHLNDFMVLVTQPYRCECAVVCVGLGLGWTRS